MNELIILLDTLAGLAWIYAGTVLLFAVGLLVFDRHETRVEHDARSARALAA